MIYYHYSSGHGLFGIMNSEKIHCSHIKFLNDPSEQKYFSTLLREVLDNNIELKTFFVEVLSIHLFESENNQPNQFVFSTSLNPDSLTMWRNYAAGNGYNFGIDIDALIRRNKELNIRKYKIEYNYRKQFSKIKKHVEKYKDYFERGESINGFEEGLFKFKESFKNDAYKNEQEIRVVIEKDDSDCFKISNNGVVIQYIALKFDMHKDIRNITIHPLGNDLHLLGIEKFIYQKIFKFTQNRMSNYYLKNNIRIQEKYDVNEYIEKYIYDEELSRKYDEAENYRNEFNKHCSKSNLSKLKIIKSVIPFQKV